MESGESGLFAIFGQASDAIALKPGVNRVNVRYKTQAGGTVGSTSVAVQTQ